MTVIAWDGKTLAADKQCGMNGLKMPVTKIRKLGGDLLFSSGDFDSALDLYAWYERGAKPEDWPILQSDKESWAALHVIRPDRTLLRYERRPLPFIIEHPFFACGSGRDYALAALHLGFDAVKAVETACRFDSGCGMGIDTLTLE